MHVPVGSLRVDPPPPFDRKKVHAIAERSAERIGRPREEVWAEIERTLSERVPPTRPTAESQDQAAGGEKAVVVTEPQPTAQTNQPIPERSNNRPPKKAR